MKNNEKLFNVFGVVFASHYLPLVGWIHFDCLRMDASCGFSFYDQGKKFREGGEKFFVFLLLSFNVKWYVELFTFSFVTSLTKNRPTICASQLVGWSREKSWAIRKKTGRHLIFINFWFYVAFLFSSFSLFSFFSHRLVCFCKVYEPVSDPPTICSGMKQQAVINEPLGVLERERESEGIPRMFRVYIEIVKGVGHLLLDKHFVNLDKGLANNFINLVSEKYLISCHHSKCSTLISR